MREFLVALNARFTSIIEKGLLPRGGHGHPRTPPSYAPASERGSTEPVGKYDVRGNAIEY